MSPASRLTLFASLRRDRLLFALLGTLVLVLAALQPLAAAQMPGGHGVLCTALDAGGMTGKAATDALDDCPVCLVGNACGAAAAHKAAPAAVAAFPAPAALAAQPVPALAADGPAERPGAPPPAIRAPPLSA